MKIISKVLMFTLILSVFAGCKKDEDNLPIADVAGTYVGTLTVSIEEKPIDVSLEIKEVSGNTATVYIPAGSISVLSLPISATCTVTSSSDKYSLSGKPTIAIPGMGDLEITIANSSIDKSGKAVINMTAVGEGLPVPSITIDFIGQKEKK
jgi:hypothetical protein